MIIYILFIDTEMNILMTLQNKMELFNHSSISISKRYLGLKQEELLQTYDSLTF